MANTVYPNFIIENKIEDILTTKLDMAQFAHADYSLEGTAGMQKKVHVYTASGSVEDLDVGEGNEDEIDVTYTPHTYDIVTTQGKYPYYDEQAMTDPACIDAGVKGLAATMVNDLTDKVIAEFGNATLSYSVSAWNFGAFVDAIALLDREDQGELFCLISPADYAEVRKALKEDLKYVEDVARTGYIGSVAGVKMFVCKAVEAGTAYIASKEAVTIFIKKGTEIEQERDADTRKNTIYARKYAVVALTNATAVVKMVKSNG